MLVDIEWQLTGWGTSLSIFSLILNVYKSALIIVEEDSHIWVLMKALFHFIESFKDVGN